MMSPKSELDGDLGIYIRLDGLSTNNFSPKTSGHMVKGPQNDLKVL